jgi:hypothetical protein
MKSGAGPHVKSDTDIMADVRKRSLVQRVCHAYESGLERGLAGRAKDQPFEATCEEGIAWELGWYQGRMRATR